MILFTQEWIDNSTNVLLTYVLYPSFQLKDKIEMTRNLRGNALSSCYFHAKPVKSFPERLFPLNTRHLLARVYT